MSEISYVDALDTFSRCERQNEKRAVLGSNSGFVISLRGAAFSLADPKDFPAEYDAWFAEFEKGVQIRFVNVEMQCFIFPSRENLADQNKRSE